MNGEEAHELLCSEQYLWRSIDHGAGRADETIQVMILEAIGFARATEGEIPANKDWADEHQKTWDEMFPDGPPDGWIDDPDLAQSLYDWGWGVECGPPEGMVITTNGEAGMTWMFDVRSPEAAAAWDIVCEEEYW